MLLGRQQAAIENFRWDRKVLQKDAMSTHVECRWENKNWRWGDVMAIIQAKEREDTNQIKDKTVGLYLF